MSDHIGDAGSRNAEKVRDLESLRDAYEARHLEHLEKIRVLHGMVSTFQTNIIIHEKINIDLSKKLAIAVEALEKINHDSQSCNDMMCMACVIASEALAKIQCT